MTAISTTYHRPSPVKGWVILAVMLVTLAIPAARATIHSGLHEEASMIRQCAAAPENLLQVWVNSSGERLNCLIDLGGGVVGDLVMQWCKKSGWVDITAYIIFDGSLAESIHVLRAKNCQQVWP